MPRRPAACAADPAPPFLDGAAAAALDVQTVAYQKPESQDSTVLLAELDQSYPMPSLDGAPAGSIVVRVLVTSICGSDLAGRCCATCAAGAWRGYTDEMTPYRGPEPELRPGGSGHEVMGEVAEVVEPCALAVGTRVLVFTTGYIRLVPAARRAYTEATGESPDDMPVQGAFCRAPPPSPPGGPTQAAD